MPRPLARIFIGSSLSTEGGRILGYLTEDLEKRTKPASRDEKKYAVSPWTDRFGPSVPTQENFGRLLGKNDFFVMILTPDAELHTLASDAVDKVCTQNLLFEIGAVYGRHGLDRLILVQDPKVVIFSDFSGITTLQLDSSNTQTVKANIHRIADEIDEHVSRALQSASDRRLRWLSLMKCKPALQRDVVRRIAQLEQSARDKWDVEYERYGVLWGPPDDFLLFSVPTIEHFISFITHLRTKFGSTLHQVDSRLVFPSKYWQQAELPRSNMTSQQLVLLSCAPQCVEDAYESLVNAAKDERARGISEVDIVTVGITTGDADVFFITAAESEALHRQFIEVHLHKNILQDGWLAENTTTLAIS